MKIKLTQGKEALIDDEDYARVTSGRKWIYNKKTGYAFRIIKKGNKSTSQYLHRFLLDAESFKHIDHINGDKLDNRKTNLRKVSRSENQKNQLKHRLGKPVGMTVIKGKSNNYIVSKINYNGTIYRLGTFDSKEQARLGYFLAENLLQVMEVDPIKLRRIVQSTTKGFLLTDFITRNKTGV